MTSRHPALLIVALTAMSACQDDSEPVLLASGTYIIRSNTNYGGPTDADLDGILLDLDLDGLTAEFIGTDDDRVMDLTRLPEDRWGEACPKGIASTPLETFEVQEPITLAGLTLDVPRILAEGCMDDEGTTVSAGWLSSKADLQRYLGSGPFELRPAP
jgi:hypothetical protein